MAELQGRTSAAPILKQMFVVSGASLNILGHGCMHGFPAVLFSQLGSSANATTEHGIVFTESDASLFASILGIITLVGLFASPVLMNRYGRQKAHLISTTPAILGWIIISLAQNVPTLIIARLLHGIAIGMKPPLAGILVAEYSSPEYRGAFLGTFAISLGLGILFTHFIGAYLTWRMTALTSSTFSVLAMVIIAFSPESPSWLAAKGRFENCSTAFYWLRGYSEKHKIELEILIASQKVGNADKGRNRSEWKSFFTAFKKMQFLKPATIAFCMFIIFEFGGAHIIPAYANRIIIDILGKAQNKTVHWQVTAVDSLRTVSALFAIVLLKKFNRRTILFTSGTLTVVSFLLISIYMHLRSHGIYSQTIDSFLPMTLIVFYVLSFCLGLIPFTWVICSEIFPLAYRSLGSTFSALCLPPAFTISLKTAPHLFSSIGVEGALLVYSAVLSICLVIIYFLLPETRDCTLEEIELAFKGGQSPSNVEVVRILNK